MSKNKLLAAKELIQEKRYAEARAILKTIDHPTAREWLAKLDNIAPDEKSSKRRVPRILLSVVIICVVIVALAAILIFRQQSADNKQKQIDVVILYCMSLGNDISQEECKNFAEATITDPNFSEIVTRCTEMYSEDLESFSVCMREVERIIELRFNNNLAQTGMIYEYCSGVLSFTIQDDACWSWANQITILQPVEYPATESCWQLEDVGSRPPQ